VPADPFEPSPAGALLLQWLERREHDQTPIEALCLAHPDRADTLRHLYAQLDRLGLVNEPTTEPASRERIGPYRILELLGSGGMGVVYLAEHAQLGRRVALKVLHPGLAKTDKARARFRREALAAARLDHPGICPVYEIGEVDGTPFLAMRHIHGRTLQNLLATSRSQDRSLLALPRQPGDSETAAILRCIEQVAHALHAAHEAGLVHRDVKPGNLILTPDGQPVLVDFGLAYADDSQGDALTLTGDQLGTPSYMSPEQIAGHAVDRRADVHALGVVLYECLTLRLPFDAPNRHDLQSQILHDEPPDPRASGRNISRDLWTVLQTALQKEPDRRYRSAAAFAEDLRRLRCHEPILARRIGPLDRALRFMRRHPVATGVLAFLLVVAVAFAVLYEQRSAAFARADVALHEAKVALRTAHANEQAVQALAAARTSPAEALDLALAAVAAARTVETVSALHEVLAQHHERLRLAHVRSTWEVAFSPDGERLVTTADNGAARVFDRKGILQRTILHNQRPGAGARPVYDVHFDPTRSGAAARFVTASDDGTARILTRDGETLQVLDHQDEHNVIRPAGTGDFSLYDPTAPPEVWQARFSADGSKVATSCSDRLVRIWNADSGKLLDQPLAGHQTPMVTLAWSLGGWLASADNMDAWPAEGASFAIRIWRPTGDRFLLAATIPVPDSVHQIAFAPTGMGLAAACRDGNAYLYELADGLPTVTRVLPHDGPVASVDFSPDGKRLLTGSNDRGLRLWSRNGELLTKTQLDGRVLRARFVGGPLPGTPLRIVSTSGDHTVRLFDDRLQPLLVLRGHSDLTWSAQLAPDQRQLVSSSWDGTARIWDLYDPERPLLLGHRAPVRALARLPDGHIVSVADDRTARIWDLETGRARAFDLGCVPRSLHVAADGQRMLVGSENGDGSARVFHPVTGQLQTEYPVPRTQWSVGVLLDHDAALLVGHTSMQRRAPGAATDWQPRVGVVYALAHAPGRGLVAAGGRGYRIPIWRDSGELWRWLPLPERKWTVSLGWSPDAQRLAVGTASGGEVWLWQVPEDPAALTSPVRLTGHGGAVHDVAFSPSGRWLAAAVSDGTVHLWDLSQTQRAAILRGHGNTAVRAVLFADDELLLSGGDDGAIQSWPISVERLIALAEARRTTVHHVDGDGDDFEFLVVNERFAEALALGERSVTTAIEAGNHRKLVFLARTITLPARKVPPRSPELLRLAARAAEQALQLAETPDFGYFEVMARVCWWQADLEAAVRWQERALASCAPHQLAVRTRLENVLGEYRTGLPQRR